MPRKDIAGEALLLMTESGSEATSLLLSMDRASTAGNAQVFVLVSLRMNGPMRPVELAAGVGMTTGGMTKVLDGLEASDLILRTSEGVEDGRGRSVVLTEEGLAHTDEMLSLVAPVMDQLIHRMVELAGDAAMITRSAG